jgi:hypothetical protein
MRSLAKKKNKTKETELQKSAAVGPVTSSSWPCMCISLLKLKGGRWGGRITVYTVCARVGIVYSVNIIIQWRRRLYDFLWKYKYSSLPWRCKVTAPPKVVLFFKGTTWMVVRIFWVVRLFLKKVVGKRKPLTEIFDFSADLQ